MTAKTTKRETVLFVDDSKLMRRAAESALSKDFRVLLASDGLEALGMLDQGDDIQAIITDLSMPLMDGQELIARIRSAPDPTRRALPVLVVTGSASEAVLKQVRKVGAAGVMTKPFKPEALVQRVQQLMESDHAGHSEHGQSVRSIESEDGAICIESSIDNLTRRLRQTIALHVRHDLPLSIMQLSVVNIDDIEARHNPRVARSVMKFAQTIIGQTLREEDSVGQTGRNTFTLVLPMTSDIGAEALSGRLQQAFRKKKVAVRGEVVELEVQLAMCDPGLSEQEIECIAAGKDQPGIVTNVIRFELSAANSSYPCDRSRQAEPAVAI